MRALWQEYKKPTFLILFSLCVFFAIYKLDRIIHFLGTAISLLMPFILGGAFAFILDIPMRRIEAFFVRRSKIPAAFARIISFFLIIILLALFIAGTWILVVPDFERAYTIVEESIPTLYDRFIAWLKSLDLTWVEEIFAQNEPLNAERVKEYLSSATRFILHGLYISSGAISSFASSAWSIFLTLLSMIYLLFDKSRLLRQFRRLAFALWGERRASSLVSFVRLTCATFENFIIGQLKMAPIFGVLVTAFMFIARMPYAVLVGFLSALFSLIPLVGATISLVLGALLLLLHNPMQALWFCIGYLILQQIEGNIIYPHVVGNSVGLSPIWILLAVSLGGSLMGVSGMLLFVPAFAVLYSCLQKYVEHREKSMKKGN